MAEAPARTAETLPQDWPVAMAGMGATLGAVYGAITGIALILLVPSDASGDVGAVDEVAPG